MVGLAEAEVLVVMGVSGSGKSTVGRLLAERLGAAFLEADELHAPESLAKMRAGTPLDDADRAPWLRRVAEAAGAQPGRVVVACSALRRSYRDLLRAGTGRPTAFLALEGPPALVAERLAARRGHFMPAGLLASQLATLEPLGADEPGLRLELGPAPERIVGAAIAALRDGG